MVEYGPVPPDRTKEYREIVNYAFRLGEGPLGPADDLDAHLYPDLGDRRAVFDEDALRCVCRHYSLSTRLRGDRHDVGGITVVASRPEDRREGHVGRLLTESIGEFRDAGAYLSALWPFSYGLYRKYGWAIGSCDVRYECAPSTLSFAADARRGRFRLVEADEWRTLQRIYDTHADRFDVDLAIDRPEAWWRERTFRRHGDPRYVYVLEIEGEPRGYVVYETGGEEGDALIDVDDVVFTDYEAFEELIRLLYDHEGQATTIRIRGLFGVELLDLVDDPTALECSVRPGAMVRLVDVERAIEALSYSPTIADRLVVSIDDPIAPCNDGRFAIEWQSGTARCDRTDADPDVRLDVATLSQLYVGYRSVADLERTGAVAVCDRDARETLDAAFPPGTPFLREYF
ncbi:MAG: GNAT family N-acetyltransferase [Halobacteriota archaeon]